MLRTRWILTALLALTMAMPASLRAQVGKSQGVVDANTATEQDLAKMPNMTPAIAKALVGVRPFKSITELNTFLIGKALTQEQAMEFYEKAFVHINLNTATPRRNSAGAGRGPADGARVRRIPAVEVVGAVRQGNRQVRRRRRDREARAVLLHPDQPEHRDRRRILSIPGAGPRMVREFKEYRPWKSWAQFDKEIGKYVGQKETDRLKRYAS